MSYLHFADHIWWDSNDDDDDDFNHFEPGFFFSKVFIVINKTKQNETKNEKIKNKICT